MKQTAVEWLVKQLRQLAHNPKTHLGMGDVRVTQGLIDELEEQAKQMEAEEQDKIYDHAFKYGQLSAPELSDEEIKEKMFGGQYDDQDINDVGEFEAAKWYREQLKQRQ